MIHSRLSTTFPSTLVVLRQNFFPVFFVRTEIRGECRRAHEMVATLGLFDIMIVMLMVHFHFFVSMKPGVPSCGTVL